MIKIAKLTPKKINHTLERNLQIANMIASNELLTTLLDPEHPIFHFEILTYTTCLNYRIYLRNTDISILASSLLYSFQNEDTQAWERYFTLNYTSAIRTLLFGHDSIHRDEIRFFKRENHEYSIDFERIAEFITLACEQVPATLSINDTDDALLVTFSNPAMENMVLTLDKAEISRIYNRRHHQEFESHELIRDYLMMQITRVFIHAQTIQTPD